jgi:hypothetical protein
VEEQGKGRLFADAGVALCDQAVEINGQKLHPDKTKGYLDFRLSHSLPVITYYGEALHPETIANSFNSMLHQPLNINHAMRIHDKENIPRDRIIGGVVGVEYGRKPSNGWKVPPQREQAPGVRAVASIFKEADGADKIIGAHQSGRKHYTVSMELNYSNLDSGFLVSGEKMPAHDTPEDLLGAGFNYIPAQEAPDDLIATRDFSRNQMRSKKPGGGRFGEWQGRDAYWLMGGIGGQVHYKGVGVVELGAEPTAGIGQLLASLEEAELAPELGEEIEALLHSLQNIYKMQLTNFSKYVQR